MKFYLYKDRAGNFNISWPSAFFKNRRKCDHSGSIAYLKNEINKMIHLHLLYLQDEIFTDTEKEKFKKQLETYRGAIAYLDKKAAASSLAAWQVK